MAKVVKWDGRRVPSELRKLPPGRYVVVPVDDQQTRLFVMEPSPASNANEIVRGIPWPNLIPPARPDQPAAASLTAFFIERLAPRAS